MKSALALLLVLAAPLAGCVSAPVVERCERYAASLAETIEATETALAKLQHPTPSRRRAGRGVEIVSSEIHVLVEREVEGISSVRVRMRTPIEADARREVELVLAEVARALGDHAAVAQWKASVTPLTRGPAEPR